MSFLTRDEVLALGFAHVGENVLISAKASIYGAARIRLGDFCRIDDFCVLSAGKGGIDIGRNVHIAIFTSLIGAGAIRIGDFSNLSSRVAVYSSNDDYSGAYLTNPTVPEAFTNVSHGPVTLGRHVIVGSGSVILPNVTLHDGVAVGALSLVVRDCDSFAIYAGAPAQRIKARQTDLLALEAKYLATSAGKDPDTA